MVKHFTLVSFEKSEFKTYKRSNKVKVKKALSHLALWNDRFFAVWMPCYTNSTPPYTVAKLIWIVLFFITADILRIFQYQSIYTAFIGYHTHFIFVEYIAGSHTCDRELWERPAPEVIKQ